MKSGPLGVFVKYLCLGGEDERALIIIQLSHSPNN